MVTVIEGYVAPDFEVGSKVQINNPLCPPGWNVVGTVDSVHNGHCVVIPDSGEFEGIKGCFVATDLLPLVPTVTVEDAEGLDALPLGTLIKDIEGDVFDKVGPDDYVWGKAGFSYGLDGEGVEETLPGVVLNPELMGEFTAPGVEPDVDGFRIGDPVVIETGTFEDVAAIGDTGVVRRFDRPYVCVDVNGVTFPFWSNELSHLTVVEDIVPDTELVGASVMDVDGLRALPVGSVIKVNRSSMIAYKTPLHWLAPGHEGDHAVRVKWVLTVFPGATVIAIVDPTQ